jgi:putative Mg2+ transporter-C (MgtC) family protein
MAEKGDCDARVRVLGPGSQRRVFRVRAAAALVLGAAVGLERQWRQRTAGLRTNAPVALGAALFELFAVLLTGQHGIDPTRIAAYVVSGIGFLGAGVILRDGIHVNGINTAATIWCSAAVGVLADAGYLPAAALTLTAHLALRPIARRVDRLPASPGTEVETTYQFRAITHAADEAHIRTLLVRELTRDDFVLHSVQSHDLDTGTGLVQVTAELQGEDRDDVALEAAVSRLSLEPTVSNGGRNGGSVRAALQRGGRVHGPGGSSGGGATARGARVRSSSSNRRPTAAAAASRAITME